nr:SGNH/GDSL hydrolase family protein [candidate division Zixibacteria bacterium]
MKRKIIFSLLVFMAAVTILEMAARLFESNYIKPKQNVSLQGWQAGFFRTFLDWHENDPDLLWRFKAGLDNPLIQTNSDHLIGPEIAPQKAPGTIRLLLLGDSSPVGLGLGTRRQAFGEILQYLLQLEFHGNKQIELINAAVSGYTSEQLARFLELRGWNYDPDLVILYCGNNDASISGPSDDFQLLESQKLISLRKALAHLAVYRILRGFLVPGKPPCSVGLTVRVDPERFKINLDNIASQCRDHGIPLIILKPPVPLLWPAGLQFKALAHETGECGELIFPGTLIDILGRKIKYCLNRDKISRLYGAGDVFTRNVFASAFIDTLTAGQAVRFYSNQTRLFPDDPIAINNLGVSLWESGQSNIAVCCLKNARHLYIKEKKDTINYNTLAAGSPFLYNIGICLLEDSVFLNPEKDSLSGAFIYLDSALQADYLSLRIKRSYLTMIDSAGNSPGVTVIDLPIIFRDRGNEFLFFDHCHPNPEGHRLIAETLFRIIRDQSLLVK